MKTDVTNLTREEVIEKIKEILVTMSGHGLAEIYNHEFGSGLTYIGDDRFQQEGLTYL